MHFLAGVKFCEAKIFAQIIMLVRGIDDIIDQNSVVNIRIVDNAARWQTTDEILIPAFGIVIKLSLFQFQPGILIDASLML